MLKDSKAVATLATRDQGASNAFYGETLGLPAMVSSDTFAAYQLPDGSAISVYTRPNHVPPENTSASFIVADLAAEMADLRSRGVTFEEYDAPGIKTVNGVATDDDGGKVAWFKDPDGNIIALTSLPQPG
jgi:catechol 2,3-dioxygenase-like lactoylglutathione lyase family enzyme